MVQPLTFAGFLKVMPVNTGSLTNNEMHLFQRDLSRVFSISPSSLMILCSSNLHRDTSFICIFQVITQAMMAELPVLAAILSRLFETSKYDIISYCLVVCFSSSCLVLPCPFLACRVVSCRVVSCRVMRCGVLSCNAVSCLVLSCGVMSCNAVRCCVMQCRVV